MAVAAVVHGVAMLGVVTFGGIFVGRCRMADAALRPGGDGIARQGVGERRRLGAVIHRLDGEEIVAVGKAEYLVPLILTAEERIRFGVKRCRRIELDICIDLCRRPAYVVVTRSAVVAVIVTRRGP